jgi:hypothetical protein
LAETAAPRKISPTDVSQFIRLDQCERYLRLRLYERAVGQRFLYDYDVAPQSIPPILTKSGADFEQVIEADIGMGDAAIDCPTRAGSSAARGDDNMFVLEQARDLRVGSVCFLFQPRLVVDLDGWLVRGDVDILRLERQADGTLHAMIADMKSSTSAKLEHRLQVAFYHEMLARLFDREGIVCEEIQTSILYRGPASGTAGLRPKEAALQAQQRTLAQTYFHTDAALLDIVSNPEDYRDSVRDLVTGSDSLATRVSQAEFAELPYHLTYKCDGCLYNEFCMKWSAEHDDLSLLPSITENDKKVLCKMGVTTTRELATLKDFVSPDSKELVPAPRKELLVRQLGAAWPVGPRLDELVHRARRYRAWKKEPLRSLSYIPSKGYGSLPYCAPDHNPNLVRIYIDAQHDYLYDRLYMVGALVVGCEQGVEVPERRRSVVALTDGPPETSAQEEQLFVEWIAATIRAVREVAAPDESGQPSAPLHLIFYNSFEQRLLLDGLSRHFAAILGATPLYDFMTQIAAFDSSIATFLDKEIRELKNYPMVCQSLQAVAAYLRFDWNAGQPFRQIFRTRMFDFWGKLDDPDLADPWYTSRARFNSQIPLEYAYAAWGQLPLPSAGATDEFASYRDVTLALLRDFHARRLEALEHITHDFSGNKQTVKTSFSLPDLTTFTQKARTPAQALDEFVTIERHVELAAWKSARLLPPERRVLAGTTLLVRYNESDQAPELLTTLRENERRRALRQQYVADFLAANPKRKRATLTPAQQAETEQLPLPAPYRLRLDLTDVDCDLEQALLLSGIRPGARLVICPRWTVDERLPPEQQTPFTPTPKQMLYATRADLQRLMVNRDSDGRAIEAFAEVILSTSPVGGPKYRGFVFPGYERPLIDDQRYTLDEDPNSWYGYWCASAVEELLSGGTNTLAARLENPGAAQVLWPADASAAQARFLAGMDALHAAGQQAGDADAAPLFKEMVRDYIGCHGGTPTLLVQGPPGTGKSFTTAFALLARIQGALAAGRPFRVFMTCKTHAATDVLLDKLAQAQSLLQSWRTRYPDVFASFIDRRLCDVPLFRLNPREGLPSGVTPLYRDRDRPAGLPKAIDVLQHGRWCVIAATPGGIYGLLKDAYDSLFGNALCDCLVLDEASQMNLPEAILAAAPLTTDGHLIVVGDHRQMPPIVKHDWANERRRTFQEYRSYDSLFQTLLDQQPSMIKFAESFRLHADMAAFLRREIYARDGIPYFSKRSDCLPAFDHPDPFVASVLQSTHPLVVVVHDEASSQVLNTFEQQLITPVLAALADRQTYGLDPVRGLGVVVPHRAQRAALQEALPVLTQRDPSTGLVEISAVDTVERFQGGERAAILVSATESDRDYLRAAGDFLLDPRRLNVALSRAKQKMILVASRSVFTIFSTDEETFANAQIWKNLLRRTCTEQLWQGDRNGVRVEVWGNAAEQDGCR